MFDLRMQTPDAWVQTVMGDFDSFLVDHAACERKASATGMAFVVRYPDRTALLEPMIAFAREELEHFHQVYRRLEARGLTLGADQKDPYVTALQTWVRHGANDRLLDRLVMGAVVEARGCERFGLVAEALPEGELKTFYLDITRSESRHHGLFLRLARNYFSQDDIQSRLDNLLALEARVFKNSPSSSAPLGAPTGATRPYGVDKSACRLFITDINSGRDAIARCSSKTSRRIWGVVRGFASTTRNTTVGPTDSEALS